MYSPLANGIAPMILWNCFTSTEGPAIREVPLSAIIWHPPAQNCPGSAPSTFTLHNFIRNSIFLIGHIKWRCWLPVDFELPVTWSGDRSPRDITIIVVGIAATERDLSTFFISSISRKKETTIKSWNRNGSTFFLSNYQTFYIFFIFDYEGVENAGPTCWARRRRQVHRRGPVRSCSGRVARRRRRWSAGSPCPEYHQIVLLRMWYLADAQLQRKSDLSLQFLFI